MQVAHDPVMLFSRTLPLGERVVNNIRPEQMSAATPCTEWDVRTLLDHFTMTQRASATALAGAEATPAADAPVSAGDDPRAANIEAARAAESALRAPGALERTYEMPWGETPGEVLASLLFMETMIHTWDLAKATGQETNLDSELCEAALAMGREMLTEQWRQPEQGFGPEVVVAADAPVCDRFAAFFGRQP